MINTDILMVNTEMIFVEKFYRLHFQRTFRIWRRFTFSTAFTAVQATIISHWDLCICLLIDLPLHPSPTCWPPCISWVCRAILLPWGPGPCYLFSLKWPSFRATWFASLLSCRQLWSTQQSLPWLSHFKLLIDTYPLADLIPLTVFCLFSIRIPSSYILYNLCIY